jgi:hypothetical protein
VESVVKKSKLIKTKVEETVNETEEAQESGSNAMDFGDSFSIDFQDPQRGDGLQARNPREPPMDVAPSPPVKTASKRSSGNQIPRMTRSPSQHNLSQCLLGVLTNIYSSISIKNRKKAPTAP